MSLSSDQDESNAQPQTAFVKVEPHWAQTEDTAWTCDTCDETFPTYDFLLVHVGNNLCGPNLGLTPTEPDSVAQDVDLDSKGKCSRRSPSPEATLKAYGTNPNEKPLPHRIKRPRLNQLISCQICSSGFQSAQLLARHDKEQHSRGLPFKHLGESRFAKDYKPPFKCNLCPATFSLKPNLVKHRRVHLMSTFKCGICQATFQTLQVLNAHIQETHDLLRKPGALVTSISASTDTNFKCGICGKDQFTNIHSLNAHMESHKPKGPEAEEKVTPEAEENITPGDPVDLPKSYLFEPPTAGFPVQPKLRKVAFDCKICGRQFQRLHLFHAHIQVFHPAFFWTGSDAIQVRERVSENAEEEVVSGTEGISPFQCGYCEETFPYLGELVRHQIQAHPGERKRGLAIKCFVCSTKIGGVGQILNHLNHCHTGRLMFQCNLCVAEFEEEGPLRQHLLLGHSGAAACPCSATYAQDSQLENHVRRIHRGKIPPVPACTVPEPAPEVADSTVPEPAPAGTVTDSPAPAPIRDEPSVPNVLKKRSFRCKLCPQRFRSPEGRKEHVRVIHNSYQQSTRCRARLEDVQVKRPIGLSLPKKLRRPVRPRRPSDLPFPCDTCTRTFKSSESLLGHRKFHGYTKRSPTVSPKCTEEPGERNTVHTVTPDLDLPSSKAVPRFRCAQCLLTFGDVFLLRSHYARSHSTRPQSQRNKFSCPYCSNARFSERGSLVKHLETHYQPLYHCPKCDLTFLSTELLQEHLVGLGQARWASEYPSVGDRPMLACPHCPCKFSSEVRHELHLGTHKGSRVNKAEDGWVLSEMDESKPILEIKGEAPAQADDAVEVKPDVESTVQVQAYAEEEELVIKDEGPDSIKIEDGLGFLDLEF